MKRIVLFLCVALACSVVYADTSVGARLQQVSVNVKAGRSQGSGLIVLAEVDGKITTWIVTANHVVDGLRQVKTVIDADGSDKKQVSYMDAEVVQEKVVNGRGVGEKKFFAKVMSVDPRRDVALLRVRADDEFRVGALFYLNEEIPQPGTALFHCGAPGGQDLGGTCSLTDGIVSRVGVNISQFGGSEHGIYDQITCPAQPGSSGGLVALSDDGRVVGIITLGVRGADSFHWMVPIRSILAFAKDTGAAWIFDPSVEPPVSENDIKLKLEVNPSGFSVSSKSNGQTKYMIDYGKNQSTDAFIDVYDLLFPRN